ncbi:PREDICTED: GPI mannosyltransferase 4 [Bactrocera latifrons]|uniref:GPI mannosyltransferase 4 n=1 Tax=Bactrocera latifrons TaxID=174628 RepID=UPI0008DCF16A|nr:PREDICTED: GPI mannosyltransferase 4 [Bactrocera latifrons]
MKLKRYINHLWLRHRNTDENWYTYLFFAVLRVVLVFIPQKGYVHPDEFFQSVEVMTGDHFQLEHVRTWEFNNTMPVRSITLQFVLLRVPWSFIEFVALYMRHYWDIELLQSYTYLVFPRFIMCALSFINDWSMYRICRLFSLNYEIRLLALGSSWVMLIFSTRTFSNTIELALCSLLLALVAECMIKTNTIIYKKEMLEERYDNAKSISERVRMWRLCKSLPAHNYSHTVLVASICVAGVFNRPTFIVYGAPMVFYWMLRGMGTKTITFRDFNFRMLLFCLSALPALVFFIICDSFYYKYLTVGELQMLQLSINNFVSTPWNFIKYNLDAKNTAEHGIHPKYVHFLVNIPLLYNVLGIVTIVSFAYLLFRFLRAEYQGLPRAQSIISLMTSAIFVPLISLSLINHQEPRFLLPLLFPIVLLHAPKLYHGLCPNYPFKEEHPLLRKIYNMLLCPQASARPLMKTWYMCNIGLAIFFGFLHQAGIFPLTQHFETIMQNKSPAQHIHLVTSHIYNVPLTFINIPSAQVMHLNRETGRRYRRHKDFYIYEYGSLDMPHLLGKIKLILSYCENKYVAKQQQYGLYLALPTSLSDSMLAEFQTLGATTNIRTQLKHIFYPHISTEALPRFHFKQHSSKATADSMLSYSYVSKQLLSFVREFGLVLYEVQPASNSQSDKLHTVKMSKRKI